MDHFIFPSDRDRADNNDLNRVCEALEALEALMDEHQRMGEALWNVLGRIDTPICRRRLRASSSAEWLVEARQALAPFKAEQESLIHTHQPGA